MQRPNFLLCAGELEPELLDRVLQLLGLESEIGVLHPLQTGLRT